MTVWHELHTGVVHPWLCDQFGHLNVRNYAVLFNEAQFFAYARAGFPQSVALKYGGHGVAAIGRTTFIKELPAGSLIKIDGGMVASSTKTFTFLLRMFNEEESSLLKAYEISNKNYGQYHILTNSILSNLSDHYLKRNFNQKGSIYLEKAITNNLFAMQKEAPFLPLDDRPFFLLGHEDDFLILYSHAALGKVNPDIALFGRLNKQGLLEEIERKQYKIIKGLSKNNELYFSKFS